MDKKEFMSELKEKLCGLPKKELEERLSFYGEMIDDRIEEGLSEEEAVNATGGADEVAGQVLGDIPLFTRVIEQNFKNISIDVSSSWLFLQPAEDGICKAVLKKGAKFCALAEVKEDTLYIRTPDKKGENGIEDNSFKDAEITLYIPVREYGRFELNTFLGEILLSGAYTFESVKIADKFSVIFCAGFTANTVEIITDSGYIISQGVSVGEITLSTVSGNVSFDDSEAKEITVKTVSGNVIFDGSKAKKITVKNVSGDVILEDAKFDGLVAETSSGNIKLTEVAAENGLELQTSSGDVIFDRSDAKEITVHTASGEVRGSLLSDKVFVCKSSSGKVKVPGTVTGGKCSVETDSGDINLVILKVIA